MSKTKGLGKGLGALLSSDGVSGLESASILNLKINDVFPNVEQPRKLFDEESLKELGESIRENGVIIPIIVKKQGIHYKIVAGERRWRASKMIGLDTIPAIVRDLTELEVLQQALIENIQRQDLNPIEEAQALAKLTEDHDLTQERLAKIVGKSRPAITNSLRLLNLPESIKEMLIFGDLTSGHARALLALPDDQMKEKAADLLIQRQASVRDAEKLVKLLLAPPKKTEKIIDEQYLQSILEFEARLSRKLGTKVKLKDRNKKGTIIIEYYSYEDLDRIYDLIAPAPEEA